MAEPLTSLPHIPARVVSEAKLVPGTGFTRVSSTASFYFGSVIYELWSNDFRVRLNLQAIGGGKNGYWRSSLYLALYSPLVHSPSYYAHPEVPLWANVTDWPSAYDQMSLLDSAPGLNGLQLEILQAEVRDCDPALMLGYYDLVETCEAKPEPSFTLE